MTIGFSNIDFNVSKGIEETTINNQNKTIVSNGEYQADLGYTGLGTVTVNTPPLIPIKTAGLSLWLDGDCNTRSGLDRSKKYFENLVWAKPYESNVKGNLENTANYNNNDWVNTNLLSLVDGFAQYPQMYCTASNEYTVETVVKITSNFSGSAQVVAGFGSQNAGAFTVYVAHDKRCYISLKGTDSTSYTVSAGSWSNTSDIVYAYFRVKANSVDGGISGAIATDEANVHPTGHAASFNTGFGCSSSTGTTPSASAGNIAVGMLRFWSRALTDSEIQANYLDAKRRFNCI